jgi:hypothetical protein
MGCTHEGLRSDFFVPEGRGQHEPLLRKKCVVERSVLQSSDTEILGRIHERVNTLRGAERIWAGESTGYLEEPALRAHDHRGSSGDSWWCLRYAQVQTAIFMIRGGSSSHGELLSN